MRDLLSKVMTGSMVAGAALLDHLRDRGVVVVRNIADCADIIDTGLPGAKADFSWDGRYIAFTAKRG